MVWNCVFVPGDSALQWLWSPQQQPDGELYVGDESDKSTSNRLKDFFPLTQLLIILSTITLDIEVMTHRQSFKNNTKAVIGRLNISVQKNNK